MTGASGNRSQPTPNANGPTSIPLSGLWPLPAKPRQAVADTVLACSTSHRIVNLIHPTSPPIEPQFTGASRVRSVCRRLICQQWNQEYSQSCSYPNCHFEHVCSICAVNPAARDINHKAIICPNHPAQNHQPINAQRPPPLFP